MEGAVWCRLLFCVAERRNVFVVFCVRKESDQGHCLCCHHHRHLAGLKVEAATDRSAGAKRLCLCLPVQSIPFLSHCLSCRQSHRLLLVSQFWNFASSTAAPHRATLTHLVVVTIFSRREHKGVSARRVSRSKPNIT